MLDNNPSSIHMTDEYIWVQIHFESADNPNHLLYKCMIWLYLPENLFPCKKVLVSLYTDLDFYRQ
ncbi:unnamed protein product [Schistosoma curassoni]|uniref:Ovule protein n=1 Tax=Schistosoma curassoni TaxID=6186 RepID=A0A183K3W2_9TREM|nr:unnamed protein product [Schistosoma curassoni]